MTDNSTQQSVAALGGLCAYISVDGAQKAGQFYEKAFGAKTVFSFPPDEQGRTMHIHQHVNGSSLMIGDFYPDHGHSYEKPQAFTLQLVLKAGEIDSWWKRAVDAGCTVEMELQDMFWGDRWGSLRDPFGVRWAMNAPKS
ncbi:MAG: glyoxalase/bleomycin resistance/extradiol dioxygenase family protein [Rhizobiales bacterium]|nr:glyoxalase/bleomycin resistance/extradiol dioxygenase family protein [Hyphomicrobiales bacterium]